MPKAKFGLITKNLPPILSSSRRILAALCLGIGIVAAGYFLRLQIQSNTQRHNVRLNQPLPAMIVETVGATVDLRSITHGLRCVIVFHSPSCRICREMLPALKPFPPELRLLLVSESHEQESPALSGFPNASVFQDRNRLLARSFGTIALPVMLFVDEYGVLRNGLAGRHQPSFVREQIRLFASDHQTESEQNH
jgi:hypothetical protein